MTYETKPVTYSLWNYDVWGNDCEGYVVNDRHCLDRAVHLPDAFNDEAILKAIDASVNAAIEWTESDSESIELVDRHTGKPIGQLTRNSEKC
jgi:hypothetical protein